MSSSLARSRSLRKPTDLSSSSTAPQRNVSPSRLPAPRPTRPTTRNVSSGSLNDTAAAAAPKKKPSALSSLLSRGSSTRQTAARKDASSTSTTATSSRTANPPTRTSSTREPTAGLNRLRNPAASSTSNLPGTSGSSGGSTRPTTSSGLAQKRTTPTSSTGPGLGHTRARSVATLNGSTTLPPPNQSSTTSRSTAPKPRPTSLYGAPSTSTTSLASSTAAARRPGSAAAQDPARPPRPGSGSSTSTTSTVTTSTTTLTHKPSVASISTRTRAGSTASTKPPSKPPTRQQTTPTSPRHPKPPVRQQQQQQTSQPASPRSPRSPPRNKPLLKPAFTTLQQHYSPAKNLAPKPLTATYLAPPSPSKLPTNVALSAETSRLQTELLQLHLLHRDLPTTTSQWHASARSHLASLHAALASSSKDLVSLEADAAERLNVAALHRWATPRKGLLEEKIQRLDALLTSLWSLDSPGGKHNRLVRAFERWASSLSDLEAARARADGPDSDPAALLDANLEVRFGGGLDARWKEECALLVRRLEGWDLQLKELAYDGEEEEEAEDVAQTSSLKRMLDGCESLIKDMLGELAVMEEIEAAAVQRETEWIKKMNRQGDDGGKRDTPRAGAVWRVI
ncbi:hypothetical protein CGCVW01_v000006 [Colletotrichum viniferum]|nr:hypothetical protein CGCVW01_v000006 [Colletotrichum viniferum]